MTTVITKTMYTLLIVMEDEMGVSFLSHHATHDAALNGAREFARTEELPKRKDIDVSQLVKKLKDERIAWDDKGIFWYQITKRDFKIKVMIE